MKMHRNAAGKALRGAQNTSFFSDYLLRSLHGLLKGSGWNKIHPSRETGCRSTRNEHGRSP
jgi:hypothetical protein